MVKLSYVKNLVVLLPFFSFFSCSPFPLCQDYLATTWEKTFGKFCITY